MSESKTYIIAFTGRPCTLSGVLDFMHKWFPRYAVKELEHVSYEDTVLNLDMEEHKWPEPKDKHAD